MAEVQQQKWQQIFVQEIKSQRIRISGDEPHEVAQWVYSLHGGGDHSYSISPRPVPFLAKRWKMDTETLKMLY